MITERKQPRRLYRWFRVVASARSLLCLGLLVFCSTPSWAQEVQEQAPPISIEPGAAPVSSSFRGRPDGAIPFQDYRLHLEANQSVRIDLVSPAPSAPGSSGAPDENQATDPYLELRRAGEETPFKIDDDSGEGLNSRMIFTALTAGDFIIRARPLGSLEDGGTATYALTVTAIPSPPPPTDFAGNRVEGTLGDDNPEDIGFEHVRYAAYWLRGRAGERLQLDMTSSGPTPSLLLTDENGTPLAANVGYGGNEVRLITVLPATGRYQVRAQAPIGQSDRYSIALARAEAPLMAEPEEIEPGESNASALTLRSPASTGGGGSGQIEFFYDLYDLDVQRGRPVTVTVTSTEFDPVLEAGTLSVLGFVPALNDSDSRIGSARITITPFLSDTISIRVRSSSGLDIGSYRLEISPEGGVAPR